MKSILIAAISLSIFAGCSKSSPSADVTVAPTADFKIGNSNGEVNEGAALLVTNNSTSSSAIQSYHWDFGNGKTSDVQAPSFSYPMHGTYDVKLTITDNKGGTSTITKSVTVLCVFASPNHPPLF